jgi:adenosylcobinamide kinase/adenosylcobinamide-phosphate guanylyltransferase
LRELILGGVKSGKSRYAEQRAGNTGLPVTYIATAVAGDEEMRRRIAEHRRRRPPDWETVEAGPALADVLVARAAPRRCLLVDCLTLWLAGLIEEPLRLQRERDALLAALPTLPGRIVMVSNEVGLGVIPLGETNRRFVDEAGRLHQALAADCERVVFTVAGLPSVLKEISE